ncbi:MAG: methyltransferase domain-containing protein [Candidatus Omnitrophota bacterium]|nr:MAG: methyltransferase domain-containing protein [Candidatus Omnitrophota bacterium]
MSKTFFQRQSCRLCGGNDLKNVLPLTPTALCDAFVSPENINQEQEIYPLDLFMCSDCGYVHLPYVVNPEIIYRDYIYSTTSSLGLSEHFQSYSEEVMHRINPSKGALVVDIGSNDGTLLKFFKKRGMRILGVEPANEIARKATTSGIETLPDFFSSELADKIVKDFGPTTIVTVNNLFANIDDLEGFTKAICKLLTPEGVFVVESSYLGDMMQNMVFDFIYHEHLSYFLIKPLIGFFRRFNMELIDVEHVPTKGGSLRYYFQLKGGPRYILPSVAKMIAHEDSLGLDRPETFKAFSDKIDSRKSQLMNKLGELNSQKKTIAGYGGSATTTTLIHHFGLGKMMDYIVDDNPAKQGTFSPGYHIPVFPSGLLYKRKPDYVLILAWRYAKPIMKKHRAFLEQGGHFIVPLPELEVI